MCNVQGFVHVAPAQHRLMPWLCSYYVDKIDLICEFMGKFWYCFSVVLLTSGVSYGNMQCTSYF